MLLLCWISKPKHYRYLIYQIRDALQTYCLSYFALDMLGSGFSKWLRRPFCSSVFTCSFLPTTSSNDFLTSSFSTSKDWWKHFRNSEFVLRHSRYSSHRLRLKEPMHFLNQRYQDYFAIWVTRPPEIFQRIWHEFWLVSIPNEYFMVWGFTVEMSLNCDLCHLLQYIQIFPVNVNYSARTAPYVYVI